MESGDMTDYTAGVAKGNHQVARAHSAADAMAEKNRKIARASGRSFKRYSEDQPRDEDGRWTDGGGSDSGGSSGGSSNVGSGNGKGEAKSAGSGSGAGGKAEAAAWNKHRQQQRQPLTDTKS
jgi:hypothetical protein